MHWSEVSRNPISPDATKYAKAQLDRVHKGRHPGEELFLDLYIKAKNVLDIGVVEHDLSFTSRPGWKHNQLRSKAKSILGVDVLPKEIEHLRSIGYNVQLCDATSDADLGARFDTVYIGDVIEHVNDPVRLLKFAGRHLAREGQVVVTTPCPYWWRNIGMMIRDNTYIGNVDHVSWVTPVNALELGYRAGLVLDHYYTIETHGSTFAKKAFKWLIESTIGKSELFTWAYAYVFKGRQEQSLQ